MKNFDEWRWGDGESFPKLLSQPFLLYRSDNFHRSYITNIDIDIDIDIDIF